MKEFAGVHVSPLSSFFKLVLFKMRALYFIFEKPLILKRSGSKKNFSRTCEPTKCFAYYTPITTKCGKVTPSLNFIFPFRIMKEMKLMDDFDLI